jgi:hypothetical protein
VATLTERFSSSRQDVVELLVAFASSPTFTGRAAP